VKVRIDRKRGKRTRIMTECRTTPARLCTQLRHGTIKTASRGPTVQSGRYFRGLLIKPSRRRPLTTTANRSVHAYFIRVRFHSRPCTSVDDFRRRGFPSSYGRTDGIYGRRSRRTNTITVRTARPEPGLAKIRRRTPIAFPIESIPKSVVFRKVLLDNYSRH